MTDSLDRSEEEKPNKRRVLLEKQNETATFFFKIIKIEGFWGFSGYIKKII